MKKIYRILSAAVCALSLAGCAASLDSFDEQLDSLEGRIAALEPSVKNLNSSVEILQSVASGYSVQSVVLKGGVYTITLSNARELTITAGEIPTAPAPVLTISDDHYWKVDLQDGAGASYLLGTSGEKLLAKGKDGVVPQFSVDAEGYWTVSYDGTAFTQLKDVSGKSVKALESGEGSDKFFSAVAVVGNELCLTTKDGKTYKAPIVPDFAFAIKSEEDVSYFNFGDVRQYALTRQGVATAVAFAPAGWSAKIDGDMLLVYAPAAPTKSSEIASASSDVAILAISESGYATISRVKVSLATSVKPEVLMTSVSEIGADGAKISVTVNTMTGLYYLVQSAFDDAPTADEVVVKGKLSSSSEIVLSGLDMVSAYKVFIVPINGVLTGSRASLSFKTTDYADYLEAWNSGKELSICGTKYSKALNGEAVSIVASAAETSLNEAIDGKSGVLMLEEAEGASFNLTAALTPTAPIILIGRYSAKPATIKFAAQVKMDTYGIVAKGLRLDCCGYTSKVFVTIGTGDPIDRLHFDSCQILADQNVNFCSCAAGRSCKSYRFYNNYIESKNTRYTFTNFSGCARWCDIEEFDFINNIAYCPSAAGNNHDFSISATNATALSGTDTGKRAVARVTNNTFYNTHGGFTIFGFNWVKSFNFNKNLVCCLETTGTGNSTVLKLLSPAEGQPTDPVIDMSDNIVYDVVKKWYEEITSSTHNPDKIQTFMTQINDNPIPSPDFARHIFTPVDEFSAYGAQ